jgi:hypothetical protein
MTVWRIIIDCVLLFLVFMTPWWVSMLIAAVCVFIFHIFYEIIILGLIIDSLYNMPVARFHNIQFVVTIGAIVLLLISVYIKGRVRYYDLS